MKATAEQTKSLYRSQSQRLADQGLSILKEKLYKNETPWSTIAQSPKEGIVIFEDICDLSFAPLNLRKFKRKGSLKCIHKKVKGTEEWWLVIARIEIAPKEKKSLLFKRNKKSRDAKVFASYLILHKSSNLVLS